MGRWLRRCGVAAAAVVLVSGCQDEPSPHEVLFTVSVAATVCPVDGGASDECFSMPVPDAQVSIEDGGAVLWRGDVDRDGELRAEVPASGTVAVHVSSRLLADDMSSEHFLGDSAGGLSVNFTAPDVYVWEKKEG